MESISIWVIIIISVVASIVDARNKAEKNRHGRTARPPRPVMSEAWPVIPAMEEDKDVQVIDNRLERPSVEVNLPSAAVSANSYAHASVTSNVAQFESEGQRAVTRRKKKEEKPAEGKRIVKDLKDLVIYSEIMKPKFD